MMEDVELRMECVKIAAVGKGGWSADCVIDEAERLFRYVAGLPQVAGKDVEAVKRRLPIDEVA